ncbi:hypothetical protein S140_216 [Shewanella sp. phage 1/40]|uniref:hypothetical protein n=1 Tax=Shewanella phage 1/4 TaxID=1458859 RepID=UPI0004F8B078|nr:hypothetical protein S14_216 [Shewanella sp. phage 1/4]YP_009104214.1 hypothetical protein S140_216 [Shewanella sp. phage 1/40]AHK11325.1 hypothetical protein S14_216 [Shewanella sp. phage 1/4]AHK11623.1 hypothetical protein S140_216 [Shewanella sp. phage 1/40]
MDSLKFLCEQTKAINSNLVVKTNGDTDLFNKKLYAVYLNNIKLTPFYSVKEWSFQKLHSCESIRKLIYK